MTRTLLRLFRENAFYIVLFGIIAAAVIVLRTTPTAVASIGEFDSMLVAGRPTVIEFFSNT